MRVKIVDSFCTFAAQRIHAAMFARSEVYAKPGELMQGALPGNHRFLLSNKSSRLFKTTTRIGITDEKDTQQLNVKSQKALEVFWSSLRNKESVPGIHQLYVQQTSNIPVGKGMSSSSADVLGVLSALNSFYKTGYSIPHLYDLAAAIEPTDPCLHEESLLFNQDKGALIEALPLLPYCLVYFDSDKFAQVDTLALSGSIAYTAHERQEYAELCRIVVRATIRKDYASFYACLHRSAELNQRILPKTNFLLLQDFAAQYKVGLFVAHSGTYMGLVAEPSRLKEIEAIAVEMIDRNWDTTIYIE